MVVTRFAPSPTGSLHIGSVRTALFCYLLAKHHKGQYILRIEDTDLERSTQASVDNILQGLQWLGLEHDEGPYYQTQRFDRYKEVIKQLIEKGHAYRCECSKEHLEAVRESQKAAKEKHKYDGTCRLKNIPDSTDKPFVVRFKNPQAGSVIFNDMVKGRIEISNDELDDLIIARTDGSPTYNFTVVVDDWDMKVTHVMRGDDHINNTPRQINILKALEAPVPAYGHMPMILGADGKRLSKRHGAVNVMQYQEAGYLPHALLNYLVRLGWSHGDQEIFSAKEMIDYFDVKHINSAASCFDLEKLNWLNQHYIKTMPVAELVSCALPYFEKAGVNFNNGPKLESVIIALRERCKTLVELVEKSDFLFNDSVSIDPTVASKVFNTETVGLLTKLITKFELLDRWDPETIHACCQDFAKDAEIKLGMIAQPLRVAVTGGTISPSIDVTLALVGQSRTISRIKAAIK